MRALSATDCLFLLLETRKQPMHVAGLCVFELPLDACDDFLYQFVEQIKTNPIKPTFPFNQVLHRLGFWRTDENFEINHHFRHIALPKPCGMNELLAYISREHGRAMDKSKPLWEFHLIDGLAPAKVGRPARFAIWLKAHHSMTDGIAAMRLLRMSLSADPTERMSTPFWTLSTKHRNQIDALLPLHKAPSDIIKEQFSNLYPVGRELLYGLQKRYQNNPHFVSTFNAPKSILNQRIGSTRTLLAGSFAKSRFASIAKAFDATTNDVILAVCSGALRQYLVSQNALPTKPLIAFVPISLRRDGTGIGNQLSFLLANLGTHKSTPQARLNTIKNSMNDGKKRFGRMNQSQIVSYSAICYAWAGANLATRALPQHQAFNLIISSVPSDNTPMYLNGAKLTNIYPASVLFDGQALNITLTSHQDTLDFGITACARTLPQIDNLLKFLENELLAFEKSLS